MKSGFVGRVVIVHEHLFDFFCTASVDEVAVKVLGFLLGFGTCFASSYLWSLGDSSRELAASYTILFLSLADLTNSMMSWEENSIEYT